MAFESANISVLIVDADEFSLAILANVLIAWKFKGMCVFVLITTHQPLLLYT